MKEGEGERLKRRAPTRRQHVVPRLLLLGFADADGKVRATHRGGRTHLQAAGNSSIFKDFYSFRNSAGQFDDTVERWLANHVEAPVAAALRAAQDGLSPTPASVPAIARFAAAALLRTPHARAIMHAIDQMLGPELLASDQLDRAGHDYASLSPRERELVLEHAGRIWDTGRDQAEVRKSMLRTTQRQIDQLAERFMTWTWTVLTAEEPMLVTADVAAATLPQCGTWAGLLPVGSPVYMPVSPRHLLLGEEHPLTGAATRLDAELAGVVNQELARWAHDIVITHPTMPWPRGLTLGPNRPVPPRPVITRTEAAGDPTFPVTYRPIVDPTIRATLDALGAMDEVP